jgi:hypothetical protein
LPAPKDDGFDEIRRLAARDAERALGIWRPEPAPIPKQVVPGTLTSSASALVPATTAAAAQNNAATAAAQNNAAAAAAQNNAAAAATQNNLATAAAQNNAANAAPAAAVQNIAASTQAEPLAPAAAPAPRRRRSAKAIEHFGAEPDDLAPPPPAPQTPPPAPQTSPAAPAPPLATVESQEPYLELSATPTVDELARAARSAPNPNQRIELIGRLRTFKSPVVVATLRDLVKSEDPSVRGAAESAMASLFGPNWNRTRPVPKPIQTPPSDDKDRGPPGGW